MPRPNHDPAQPGEHTVAPDVTPELTNRGGPPPRVVPEPKDDRPTQRLPEYQEALDAMERGEQ